MTAHLYVLGIDPGLQGGIVLLDEVGQPLQSWKAPVVSGSYDRAAMLDVLESATTIARHHGDGSMVAAIEQVVIGPPRGQKGAISIGYGHGLWHMALTVRGIGFEALDPQAWQKGLPGLTERRKVKTRKHPDGVWKWRGKSGKALKDALMKVARERWPELPRHSGICDAALIAEHLRRTRIRGAA